MHTVKNIPRCETDGVNKNVLRDVCKSIHILFNGHFWVHTKYKLHLKFTDELTVNLPSSIIGTVN